MARFYEQAKEELTDTREELEEVLSMSEAEVCHQYNVDSKAEIINELSGDIEYLQNEVSRLTPMDFNSDTVIDIFGGYAAMNAFLY